MLLTESCYYTENQGFGGARNRDMSLNETCFCSRLNSILAFVSIFPGYPGSPEIQRDELLQGPTKCNIPELPRTDSGGLRFTERNIFLFQFENDTLISCGGTNAVDIKLCYKLDPKTHSWSMHSTMLHMVTREIITLKT